MIMFFCKATGLAVLRRGIEQQEMNKLPEVSTPTYLFDLISLMALLTSSTNKSTKAELNQSSFLVFVLWDLFCSEAKECKVGFPKLYLSI